MDLPRMPRLLKHSLCLPGNHSCVQPIHTTTVCKSSVPITMGNQKGTKNIGKDKSGKVS